MRARAAATAVLAIALAASARADDAADAKFLALIRPSAGEASWTKIAWNPDLLDARRLAAEQGRPIFLWEMDGNPLGCT